MGGNITDNHSGEHGTGHGGNHSGDGAHKAITAAALRSYSEDFNADRANRVAANAAVSSGVLQAATSYQGVRELPRSFSIELKQGGITDQAHSGRCWMFASLNTLRYELMHRWNLEDFEFSETYLFFWDKIEKANTYLENVLSTLDEATDSRIFRVINEGPTNDGGWWQMFVNLVNKYGLVPKSAYPESANSHDSGAFTQYLNTKLREFAAQMRAKHAAGASIDELRTEKIDNMRTVYRITAIALGEPPASFDFLARVKEGDEGKGDNKDGNVAGKAGTAGKADTANTASGKTNGTTGKADEYSTQTSGGTAQTDTAACTNEADTAQTNNEAEPNEAKTGKDEREQIREYGITPVEFYRKYVPVDVNDFVTLCNAPMASTPFGKRYRIAYTTNVAETGPMEFLNVPLDVFRTAAVSQLSAGHPIWFACDCMQFSLRKAGFFDRDVVRVDELFGTEFTFDKADGLEYGDRPSNHAMTFTGVNLDPTGKPDRWKVENSWGKDSGKDGYYVASNAWFDQFVTEIIIRKEYLDQATLAMLDTEPVTLDPWQPLTKRCR
jgi:bleomycin hydrolase